MSRSPHVVVVLGPTASGKSSLAVDLARELGEERSGPTGRGPAGEVINADAVQLFRGMDIGSAKITAAQRRGVPHHLLDVLDVEQATSVAAFQREARRIIDDCLRRGVFPILTGGSSLYVRAVIDDFDFPGTDPDLRAALMERLDREGSAALHAELAQVAPEAAAHLEPTNGRRIVRALEVTALTGRPFQAQLPPHASIYDPVTLIGLSVPRAEIDDRIAERVERMWQDGFVEEVRSLAAAGLAQSPTAGRSLGYQQVLEHLSGDLTDTEAREATVRGTRAFARRQERLFVRDPRITWLPYDAPDVVERALEAIDRDPSR